jgi:hypothetical protein
MMRKLVIEQNWLSSEQMENQNFRVNLTRTRVARFGSQNRFDDICALASIIMLFVLVVLMLVSAQDPADSWLAYCISPGGGGRVTRVNVTWTVMAYPTIMSGGNAPGWWYN